MFDPSVLASFHPMLRYLREAPGDAEHPNAGDAFRERDTVYVWMRRIETYYMIRRIAGMLMDAVTYRAIQQERLPCGGCWRCKECRSIEDRGPRFSDCRSTVETFFRVNGYKLLYHPFEIIAPRH